MRKNNDKVLFSVYHKITKRYIIEPSRISYSRAHTLYNMPNAWDNCTISGYFIDDGQPAFRKG